jgi:hypothetical protein
MIIRLARFLRTLSADVLAAALLTLATLAAVSADVGPDAVTAPVLTAASDDGLPGQGRPPSPGPTNPDGPY